MNPTDDDKNIFLALLDASIVFGTAPESDISQRVSIKCLESIAFYVEPLSIMRKKSLRNLIELERRTGEYLANELDFIDEYWLGSLGILSYQESD